MTRSQLTIVGLLALPLVGLAILLAAPETDVHWQHQPAHFWLVLLTAGLNAVLAYATGVAARRRGDRRVHLVSLSFLAASGFLALHALATPGVLLDRPNLGFVIATPVGLVLAGALAALSAIDSEPIPPKYLERALLVLLALWAVVCLSLFPEVDDSVVPERLSGEMVALSVAGIVFYTFAVVRYLGALPRAALAARARFHGRVHPARGGDGRRRTRPQLAGLVVGVAPADADRLRGDRRDGAPAGLGGAVRPPVRRTRRGARDRPLRRPGGLHVVLGASRAGGGLENAGHALRSGDPGDRAARRCHRQADRRCRLRDVRGRGHAERAARAALALQEETGSPGRRAPAVAALPGRPEHGRGRRSASWAPAAAGRTALSATPSTSARGSRRSRPQAVSRSARRRRKAPGRRDRAARHRPAEGTRASRSRFCCCRRLPPG